MDELIIGFLSGSFSKFLTTPIANIVTRKQTSSMLSARDPDEASDHGSIRSIALRIHAEKGVQGFWSGYSASLVLTLNPSLTFLFFETLKRTLLPRNQRSNPPTQAVFLLAAFSKALASTISYPFSLAKSRLQAATAKMRDISNLKSDPPRRQRLPTNVFTTILEIAQNEGVNALYEGLEGEVLKGFFSHGITMIVKEAVHKVVIQLYYTVLKLLKRFPSPHDLAVPMQEKAGKALEDLREETLQTANSLKGGMERITDLSQTSVEEAEKNSNAKGEL